MANLRTEAPDRCEWCGEKPPRGTKLEPLIVVGGFHWICKPCRQRGMRRPNRKPTPGPTFGPVQLSFQFMQPNK